MTFPIHQHAADLLRNFGSTFGRVHIVGIGGIGMSGIAEILHAMGCSVQGSDMSDNANVRRLRGLGIKIFEGHHADNIVSAGVVAVSSAIRPDNVEIVAAQAQRLPVISRAEMLAAVMGFAPSITISGTHGKTTTSALVATILDGAGFDPTVITGGIIETYGSNARTGRGDWMVVEADESDGTFTRLPSTIGAITNIDPEHLEHYGDYAGLIAAFETYLTNIPFYGAGVVCLDHPQVRDLMAKTSNRRLITYGFDDAADVRAVNYTQARLCQNFDVAVRLPHTNDRVMVGFSLPMAGRHNVQNALAAIAIALVLNIPEADIRAALAGFAGVNRRFTHIATHAGADIFDDYAHHPVEIAATLAAVRDFAKGRVIAVVQPHRYSRLQRLFDDFCTSFTDADMVFVLPVYAAGETPIDNINAAALADGITQAGHSHAQALATDDDLAGALARAFRAGDVIMCMGAGSISHIAHGLAARLKEIA